MSQAGELIREARQRSKLSQSELARRAGTTQAAISRIERGLEDPTVERFEQILAGLGWRPHIELEPISLHDEEPRRLYEDVGTEPAERLKRGVAMARLGRKLVGAASGRG